MPLTTDYRAAITHHKPATQIRPACRNRYLRSSRTVLTANKRLGKGVAELVILQMERTRKESVAAFKKLADQGITVYLIELAPKTVALSWRRVIWMTDDEGNVVHIRD